jgi:hypothetical protein
MEWVPLLIISRGNSRLAHLLQGLSLPLLALLLLSNRKDKLKFSDGDWVTGQPKPHFATFASGDLAGKMTYKFAKLNDKHTYENDGKLLSSTEIH